MSLHHLRSAAAWLLLCSVAVLIGCRSDSPVAPTLDVTGTYTLQTVNGSEVPLLFYEDDEVVVELVGGTVVLAADGTFQETLIFAETARDAEEAEIVEFEAAGTYSVGGGTITFVSADEGTWTAAAVQGEITYAIWNVPFTFRM